MITRVLEESIRNKLGQDKAIVIMGARQVGKTTLIETSVQRKRRYIVAQWRRTGYSCTF